MIELIRNFALNESVDDCCQPIASITDKINKLYTRCKELSLNLNDEISKLSISDSDTFNGVIHKLTYDLPKVTRFDIVNNRVSDEERTMTMSVQLSASELKDMLYKIPGLILLLANELVEYAKNNEVTDIMVSNAHDYLTLLSHSAMELIALTKINNNSLTEASEENVSDYVDELNKVINDIREYYEKSDYSKILTPRKKTVDKMEEYMKGALERKYTLRIPLYKIEDAKKDARDVIENKFIKDVQSIVAKYDNYALLTPTWDEDEDIFIYLTLKEPFGKKGDSEKRQKDSESDLVDKVENPNTDTNSNKELNESTTKMSEKDMDALNAKISSLQKEIDRNEKIQSEYAAKYGRENSGLYNQHDKLVDKMEELCRQRRNAKIINESVSLNEATKMTKEERDALPDSEFGLPELRKYPLNDEVHIKQAIKHFHYAKAQHKELLAKNITKKVKEKGLVGKVTVSKRNPFKKYFPSWMIEGGDADDFSTGEKKKKAQNETVVFINDKLI